MVTLTSIALPSCKEYLVSIKHAQFIYGGAQCCIYYGFKLKRMSNA